MARVYGRADPETDVLAAPADTQWLAVLGVVAYRTAFGPATARLARSGRVR